MIFQDRGAVITSQHTNSLTKRTLGPLTSPAGNPVKIPPPELVIRNDTSEGWAYIHNS